MTALHDTGYKLPARSPVSKRTTFTRPRSPESGGRWAWASDIRRFRPDNVQFHFHQTRKADRFCEVSRQVGVMTGRKTTIHLEDDADRWRWVCPRGHRTWEPTNYHFWCAKCARQWSQDDEFSPEFDELRDKRSCETKTREEIRLVTPAGPYEHREGSA